MTLAAAILAQVANRRERIRRYPGSAYRWLPNQAAFRRSRAKIRMIRQGNQWGGKTTVALDEVLLHMRGHHPEKPVPLAPVEWWILCAESSQSIAIQRKMWDLCDPDEVHPECLFDEARGFRGRNPVLRLKNGSIARFKTTGQRTITLAGATIDGVLFDEPPTSVRLFTEIQKRVMNRGGTILIAMTPVNAGPLGWLQDLVDNGTIEDHHSRLTAEALIPEGETEPVSLGDGTVCDQAWIDAQLAATPEHERDVVCHGEWEFKAVDRMFTAFVDSMVSNHRPPPGVAVHVRLGLDHGDKVGKQYGVLLFLLPGPTPDLDEVWAVDETPETEHSTEDADAGEVLAMLARAGLTWAQVDEATGDRAYERGSTKKSNLDLQRAIARRLRQSTDKIVPIHTAKRTKDTGRTSVDQGIRYLHRLMCGGRFHVSPRCVRLAEALKRWDGRQKQSRSTGKGVFVDSYYKDPIDAMRYGLESRIFAPGRERATLAPVRFGP